MKNLFSYLVFIIVLSFSYSTLSNAQTGRCCQLEPGPKICGTCTQDQCGGSGGCSNCNETSVFQGQPGFEACSPKIPLCTWDLWDEYCQKWSVPAKEKHPPESRVPGQAGGTPKVCLQWGSRKIDTRQIPCNQTMMSNVAGQTWVQQPNP